MKSKHEERMRRFLEAGLYPVVSEPISGGRTAIDIVAACLAGGARLIQLRGKNLPAAELFRLAGIARRLTAEAGAILIINDRLDIALAANADGVHLGRDDLPLPCARRLAPDLIIGASTHSVAEALDAQEAGASYVNIGPIFPTRTKDWRGAFLGIEGLRKIAGAISLPFTVMGGIKKQHIPGLLEAGARTIALVTAVTQADDPERAVRDLLARIRAA